MSTLRSLLPALGVGLFLAPGPGEEIAFRPESGATVSKVFTVSGEYELDELSVVVSGQDLSGMMPAIELTLKQETKVAVTDVYRSFRDGRLLELARTFDELSGAMHMTMSPSEGEMPDMGSASDLEGRTVVFKWNPDREAYDRTFESGDGDAELLEGLEVDMDLRAFLPEGDVDVDETWSVPIPELMFLLTPGGDLAFEPVGMEVDQASLERFEQIFSNLGDRLADQVEGDCTCTFKGTREEDGRKIAEIAIDIGIATTLDLSEVLGEVMRAAIEESDAGDMVQISVESADLDVDFDGEGVLVWDLSAGRARAFQLSGDAVLGMNLVVGVEAQGESQDVDASIELSGTMTHELTTEE